MSEAKANKGVIHDIAQDLSTEDCSGLSFLSDLSNAAITHCCCQLHGRAGALGLLVKMEEKGVYSVSDMSPLASLLREVGRHDLASRVSSKGATFQPKEVDSAPRPRQCCLLRQLSSEQLTPCTT